ncbi:LysR substrate-binding domain-containing protein [Halomonas huangheensis]|uniref:HTH lysR-type domain-containing protein n=1 Tax=Halomonas huangheensis TaxID=1178482 RepID=W1N425_9GAMM|nr:LysR substrate-binding domain-containing protein [Halomonas huangheensis]ALM51759.1 transcriptional regulator [Halomonas huangheensis]ERL50259.1 hypothetical protein BJB45_03775 [Halomonas huangheensis]
MSYRLPSLTALRAFEAAARLNSFKKAAEELAVTATAISHRIRVLEEDLERPMFLRKVRAVELTADGQELFTAVHRGFDTIAVAVERLRKPRKVSVTLSTTPAFATKWLVPRLASFQAQHPDIDLHVHASNTPVDLHSGTVDLAIRYGSGPYEGMEATLLLENQFAPVASPTLKAATNRDISQWPLIHFDWHLPPAMELNWNAWLDANGHKAREAAAGIRYSEESHAIQAAIAGQGVAMLSLLLVEEELRLGLLKIVAEPTLKAMPYLLLQSNQRPVSQPVVVVKSWLIQSAHQAQQDR